MPIVTVTFERVFDVRQRLTGRPARRVTDFSFEAEGAKQYGVSVPGWPEIKEGHTVMAVLSESGNWQTLAGWKNQSTGETTGPNVGATVYGLVGSLSVSAFLTFQAYQTVGPLKTLCGVGAVALFPFALILGRQYFSQRAAIATLSALTTRSSGSPPATAELKR